MGRQVEDYLGFEDAQNFPCADLRTIDQLWVKYSDGRFGFSVQKQIYVETGNLLNGEYQEKSFLRFCEWVGWDVSPTGYNTNVLFKNSSLNGHFPFRGWAVRRFNFVEMDSNRNMFICGVLSRLWWRELRELSSLAQRLMKYDTSQS